MRYIWICTAFLFLSSSVFAQLDTGNTNTGGAADTGGNATGGGPNTTAGGSTSAPQGFQGGGGQSDNIGATEFGERGTANQADGFVGGNRNAQQGNFIGQNQAIGNTLNNAFGNQRGGQFGNTGFGAGGNNRGGFGSQPQRGVATQRQIRIRLVLPNDVAAEYRILPATKIQTSLSKQFAGINASQEKSKVRLGSSRVFKGSDIQITADGRTVTLRGQVSSDRERKLAERIAKLEPGVSRVVNQLEILAASR